MSDESFRIKPQLGGNLAPQPAARGGRPRSDQFDELIGADDEATVGIHLPDETQGVAALGWVFVMRTAECRRRCGGRIGNPGGRQRRRVVAGRWRSRYRGRDRHLRGLRLFPERCDQHEGRVAAEALDPHRSVVRRPAGTAACKRLRRQSSNARRREHGLAAKANTRRVGGIEKRAVGGENRAHGVAVRKQMGDTGTQCQRWSGRLGSNDQYRRGAVRERGARAETSQRAAEGRAEAP